MPGRIPQSFIDDLLSRVDIVEVIDEYVPLKKKGNNFTANCPFHDEKTPSFTVSQTKQFYHCFGCAAHGSAISFLMDYAHMDFVDAVRALAERVGLEIPQESGSQRIDFSGLYGILEKVSQFYHQQLYGHPRSSEILAYLKHRQLNREIVTRFEIGYAPPGWNTLLKTFGQTEVARRDMAKAGLITSKNGGEPYDRLRNRIVFPIRDGRGRVIGFGGRVLGEGEPKYLNTPETPVFHKGRELYGLYQAKQTSRVLSRILVVEGYMDVVALAQQGISYAIATLGTATTPEHLNRIYRIASEVVFCFDADVAGRKAAWRALEATLPLLRDGRLASFMFLPEGEDPDSFVRVVGRQAFEAKLAKAVSLGSFLFEHLLAQVDSSTLDGKARLVELAKPLLLRLPPGAFREVLLSHLGEISGLERASVEAQLAERKKVSAVQSKTGKVMPGKPVLQRTPSLLQRIISLLLHNPRVARPAIDLNRLGTLALPGVPLLVEILELLGKNPDISTGAIIEHFRDQESGQYLAQLAAGIPPVLDEGLERELSDGFDKLLGLLEEQRYKYLMHKSTESFLTKEEKQEFRLLLTSYRG